MPEKPQLAWRAGGIGLATAAPSLSRAGGRQDAGGCQGLARLCLASPARGAARTPREQAPAAPGLPRAGGCQGLARAGPCCPRPHPRGGRAGRGGLQGPRAPGCRAVSASRDLAPCAPGLARAGAARAASRDLAPRAPGLARAGAARAARAGLRGFRRGARAGWPLLPQDSPSLGAARTSRDLPPAAQGLPRAGGCSGQRSPRPVPRGGLPGPRARAPKGPRAKGAKGARAPGPQAPAPQALRPQCPSAQCPGPRARARRARACFLLGALRGQCPGAGRQCPGATRALAGG